MPESPKTVLIFQLDEQQGKIWDAALQSQGIRVDWRPANIDIVEMLKAIEAQSLPDLLIMDIGIKSSTSNSLQVVPVCNWCRSLDVPIKVLLLNSSSSQIKPYEQKWATGKCGAIAIVSKLNQATLNTTIPLIVDALESDLKIADLNQVSGLIADIYSEILESEITKIKSEIAKSSDPASKVTSISSYRGSNLDISSNSSMEDTDTRIQAPTEITSQSIPIDSPIVSKDPVKAKVTTYRGVKVNKIQW